jgi:heat shock protein HslJ
LLLIYSCHTPKKATVSATPFFGKVWDMTLYGKDTIFGTGVFLIFTDSANATGYDGCRIFGAKSKWSNKEVTLKDFRFQGDRKCDSTNVSKRILEAFQQQNSICFKNGNLCLCKKGRANLIFKERAIVEEPEDATEPTDSTSSK